MPVPQIDCCSGSGPTLASPQNFQWANYTYSDVTITNCDSWCDAAGYTVPAASQNPGAPGVTNARTKSGLSDGNYSFSSTCSDVPGNPHVTVKS